MTGFTGCSYHQGGGVWMVRSIVLVIRFLLGCPVVCVKVIPIGCPLKAWSTVTTSHSSDVCYRLYFFSVCFSDSFEKSVRTGCSSR